MLPQPGDAFCYLPLTTPINKPGIHEDAVDAFYRVPLTDDHGLFYVSTVEYLSTTIEDTLPGVGIWYTDTNHRLAPFGVTTQQIAFPRKAAQDTINPAEKHQETTYKCCRVYASDLAAGLNIIQRELVAHIAVALSQPGVEDSDVADLGSISNISLCPSLSFGKLKPSVEIEYKIRTSVFERANPQSEKSEKSTVARIRTWLQENQDELISGLLTGSAIEAAQYLIRESHESTTTLPSRPPSIHEDSMESTDSPSKDDSDTTPHKQ